MSGICWNWVIEIAMMPNQTHGNISWDCRKDSCFWYTSANSTVLQSKKKNYEISDLIDTMCIIYVIGKIYQF